MKAIDILYHLKSSGIKVYKSQQQTLITLMDFFKKDKKTVLDCLNELKKTGVIKRKFASGKCETICSSCYQYGCDKGSTPPISYWEVN